jgi:hypothetical protein
MIAVRCRTRKPRACATLVSTLLIAAACGGGSEPSSPQTIGLKIVDGDAYTDTIGAISPRLLTVEVHAGARSSSGLVVRFDAIPSSDFTRLGQPTIRVSTPGRNSFGNAVSDTTDAAGRVAMETRLGIIAGEARLVVSCPELGLADTARFTVLPGRPWRIQISGRDTTVYVGGSYLLSAYVVDGNYNRRADAVSFESLRVVAVDASGRVQTGAEVGRGVIAVRGGGLVDTAKLNVLPLQKIALFHQLPEQQLGWISTALTDGSNLKKLVQVKTPSSVSLSASGDQVLYDQETGIRPDIFVVDETGVTRMLSDSRTRASAYPRFDAVGNIFFSGLALEPRFSLFRMAGDGTGLSELATVEAVVPIAVSPDGGELVAQKSSGLYVYDVGSGAFSWIAFGASPTFSPDGKRLAYLAPIANSTGVAVANPDGSAPKVHQGRLPFLMPPAWLADSKWIITADGEGTLLVNASTGEILTLPGLTNFRMISTTP